jgi:hypothetical protein
MFKKGIFIYLLLLGFISSFISSCEYKTNEVYERKVNTDVTPPEITTIILNPLYDTIFLYSTEKVNFSFSSNNQAIKAVRLVINSNQYGIVNSGSGTFNVDPESLGNGIYKMTIEVYTATGTGSIADIL